MYPVSAARTQRSSPLDRSGGTSFNTDACSYITPNVLSRSVIEAGMSLLDFVTIFVQHNRPFLWGRRHHFGAAQHTISLGQEAPRWHGSALTRKQFCVCGSHARSPFSSTTPPYPSVCSAARKSPRDLKSLMLCWSISLLKVMSLCD